MPREPRSKLVRLSVILCSTAVLASALAVGVARFGGSRPGGDEDGATFLARTGRRCLEGIPEVDVVASEAWLGRWQRLEEADCRPGTWLYQFREAGQNLSSYQQEQPNMAQPGAPLVVTQLGTFADPRHAALVPLVREFLAIYFQRDVLVGPERDLPSEAFFPDKGISGQYDADRLSVALLPAVDPRAAATMAITERDLFVGGLQYVFGLGHFHKRIGVLSTSRMWEKRRSPETGRLEDVRSPEPLRRALKVAVHEMAHEFSVAHCVHYRRCIMGGTNSLAESDDGSLMLCPIDHAKLRWNLGFDPHARFSGLAAFAERHGLYPEARYWSAMAGEYPEYGNAKGGGR